MGNQFEVRLTATAENTYIKIFDEAQPFIAVGDELNANVKTLRTVDHAIDVTVPSDPFNSDRALSGPLSNTFSVTEGGMRIPYAGSPKQNCIVILYICEASKKTLNLHDPYVLYTNMVLSGAFDEILASLGVRTRRPSLH